MAASGGPVKDLKADVKATAPARELSDQKTLENSFVKIFSSRLTPNYPMPWSAAPVTEVTGSGFVLQQNDRVILTNAHVVSLSNFLQVKLEADSKKYTAEVLVMGHDCDLALLTVKDEEFWKRAIPLTLSHAKTVNIDTKIKAVGFPIGGKTISVTKGTISRIEVSKGAYSSYDLLSAHIDVSMSFGSSGGPVLSEQDNSVVGVQYQCTSLCGQMVPLPRIKHFLQAVSKTETGYQYHGIPTITLTTRSLENEHARKHLKMQAHHTGVQITSIGQEQSAAEFLKKGDILLEIDDMRINNDGTVNHVDCLAPVEFNHVIRMHHLWEMIKFKLLRQGCELGVSFRLTKVLGEAELCPQEFTVKEPAYLCRAGIVMQPLTRNYLNAYSVPPKPLSSFAEREQKVTSANQQVLFINLILLNEATKGYDSNRYQIIRLINGRSYQNMLEAGFELDSSTGDTCVFGMEDGTEMVVPRLDPVADAELRERYQVMFAESKPYGKIFATKRAVKDFLIWHANENKDEEEKVDESACENVSRIIARYC